MKAFIISAMEWLVLQTDNDLDDKILAKVKSGMDLGVVWLNSRAICIWLKYIESILKTFMFLFFVHSKDDWIMWCEMVAYRKSNR